MNFKIWRQIMCFRQKRKTHNNNNNNNNNNSLPEPEIEPGTSLIPFGCVTYRPPSQLNISIEVKLLTCVSVMGRNVNKQSQVCWPHFSVIFWNAWISTFVCFTYLREYDLLLVYGLKERCKQFWSRDTDIVSWNKWHKCRFCIWTPILFFI